MDGTGTLPSVIWQGGIGAVEEYASSDHLTLQVDNPYSYAISIVPTIASHGLDQRIVRRNGEPFTVGPGAVANYSVELGDLPIQSVTYSSLALVELDIDRGSDSVRLLSEPFHYHFDESYEQVSVYDFDTMNSELAGGQLVDDAQDLRGKVWSAAGYVDIEELRDQEQLPWPWPGTLRFTQTIPSPMPEPDSWPTVEDVEICFRWRTQYVDASPDHGDDYATDPLGTVHEASYVWVEITEVNSYPCPAKHPNEACLTTVWKGFVDENGCVPFGEAALATYYAWPISFYETPRPNAPPCAQDPNGPPCPYRASALYFDENDDQQGHVGVRVPVNITGPNVFALIPFIGMNNAMAVISEQLAMDELIDATATTFGNPLLTVQLYRRCLHSKGCDETIPEDDARAGRGEVYTGGWIRQDNGRPGGLQWKGVLAHELGHVQNYFLMGLWDRDYDQNAPQELCKCDIASGSNDAHCMQSREEIGAAQLEGFGHFMAAKTWNDGGQSDCNLAYYKDFKTPDLVSHPPPYAVSCFDTPKWRKSYCQSVIRGVERDWMTFFWRINNYTSTPTELSDLAAIYNQACGVRCDAEPALTWQQLRASAISYYNGQGKAAYFQHFENWGGAAGVNDTP